MEPNLDTLGVNMAGYETRNVQDCLNCKKHDCDGCPADRSEKDKKYYQNRKKKLEGIMICPVCGGQTKVADSRGDGNTVIRRRRCIKCGQNTFTKETMMEYVTGAQSMSEMYKAMYGVVIGSEIYK